MNSSALAKTILADYAKQIAPLLVEFFQEQKAQIPTSLKHARQMLDNLEDFCTRGGKRLRPALVYYGYKLLGGKNSKDIMKASLAIELIHNFLLIHDDVIDEDELRRGKMTMHKLYENECGKLYKGRGNPEHFGEGMGIIAGDLCYSLALKLLLSSNFPSELRIQALEKVQDAIITVGFGEELDIRFELNGLVKPSEILEMYRLKTGVYTFECPLHMGAILAGASKQDLAIISQYAIPVGTAFQIRDDALGMFGDQKTTGKPVGSDLKQGKQTLLIATALKKASKDERKKIQKALGDKEFDEKDVSEIRKIIEQTGALADCAKLAKEYISQAKQSLSKFQDQSWDKDAIAFLDNIADFIIERKV